MDNEKRKFYLEQVGAAASRSRLVFYLLLFSAATIFCFDWKMYPTNWLGSRIGIRHDILTHWDALASGVRPHEVPPETWSRMTEGLQRMRLNATNAGDRDIVSAQRQHLDEQWSDTFKIPFMDATFDINDFVFFSAVELLTLSLIFLYCLLREKENLRLSFIATGDAGPEVLREFYEMASMEQVWTVPQIGSRAVSFLRHLPIGIVFLPLLIMLWVFIRDRLDAGAGKVLNPTLADWVVALEYFMMALLVAVTFVTVRYFHQIGKEWDRAKAEIDKAGPSRRGQAVTC